MRSPVFSVLSAFALTLLLLPATHSLAATIRVDPGQSIQAAIDSATDGDVIELAAGEYPGNIDFSGKNLEVTGVGTSTVLLGDGTGPVVSFVAAEGPGAMIDSVTITGGRAAAGGGIHIVSASPTVVRTRIIGNQASGQGTAIAIRGVSSTPLISNNLIAYNDRTGFGDPHVIQVQSASPVIVNNTIVRGDSNAIFLSGGGATVVMNNILARNGSRGGGDEARRGRGICNFTSGAEIRYNTFWRNAKAALLQSGRDFRKIRSAERFFRVPEVEGNTDRSPRFLRRRPAADVSGMQDSDFDLHPRSRAVGAGNPGASWNNPDGSRNTMGHHGGPLANP